jgi:hypothetical protein
MALTMQLFLVQKKPKPKTRMHKGKLNYLSLASFSASSNKSKMQCFEILFGGISNFGSDDNNTIFIIIALCTFFAY